MSNITLHTDSPATTTCVPNVFIDRYMVHASGEFVKIYLYLLRCINGNKSELSISKMADKFEHKGYQTCAVLLGKTEPSPLRIR